eukprot:13675466-Alexandrium_andersonii.AAC.1
MGPLRPPEALRVQGWEGGPSGDDRRSPGAGAGAPVCAGPCSAAAGCVAGPWSCPAPAASTGG